MKEFITTGTDQTHDLGSRIGRLIQTGMAIALKGDLGAGKTTFVQGLAKGTGVPGDYYVTSPTFSIINEYPAGRLMLYHIDLYRLGSPDELEFIGFDDLPGPDSLIVVEWPQILEDDRFEFDLEITITADESFNRVFRLRALSNQGKALIDNLQALDNSI